METFREIEIAGAAYGRGVMHGEQLRGEIAAALAFYREVFGLADDELRARAAHFERVITGFNPDYAEEIRGIADGAGLEVPWIVALNARTEILAAVRNAAPDECTALCFPDRAILGQTWDWGEPLEPLCAVVRIERPDGHVIRMLCEPGMVGKIGMNSAGLGVCLNILRLGEALDGVPVHVMLRAILDCRSVAEATAVIDREPGGKSSNVLVADSAGNCFDMEFAGGETFLPGALDGVFVHTNHYLGREINAPDDPLFGNSRTRMKTTTARAQRAAGHTVPEMIDILSDNSNDEFPVYRPYRPDPELGPVGTVATIVMDLTARDFHIRRGNDPASPFTRYAVG